MTVFLDTGVFIGFLNKSDENHEEAKAIFARVAGNQLGTPYTSDYVFSEAVTMAYRRTKRQDLAVGVGKFILGESPKPLVVVARVTENTFSDSWVLFQKHSERGLSFTDCTSLVLMKERGIESIASFDGGFDGLAQRISS